MDCRLLSVSCFPSPEFFLNIPLHEQDVIYGLSYEGQHLRRSLMSSLIGWFGNIGAKSIPAIWNDRILPSVLAGILGCTIVFAMGFAETSALHNAAHDGRHSAGFPCH
jgi:cobalt transporter subunit CbtB